MGKIGVRCAASHSTLWFHLDVAFATDHLHPDFRIDGRDRKLNNLLGRTQPWDGLTKVGKEITTRVLPLKGVVSLSARPDYFDLTIRREKDWQRILPATIAIIKEVTKDPQAKVEPYIRKNSTVVEQWHLPLLAGL